MIIKKIVGIISIILSVFAICGCGKENYSNYFDNSASRPSSNSSIEISEGEELFALADTEEAAEQIAELYGITLVRFSYGVATFHTDENPSAVIARGIENDWPLLELNHKNSLN